MQVEDLLQGIVDKIQEVCQKHCKDSCRQLISQLSLTVSASSGTTRDKYFQWQKRGKGRAIPREDRTRSTELTRLTLSFTPDLALYPSDDGYDVTDISRRI